eukprot:TRINITY_DN31311_c0_g1_i1.p1 TRINITY_DN31311_c0_g1~~TRINITY_DN31311_c0_g1_i1.p1  ORF type:complete len:940 (-),score=260.18 TRINITY_DN31311_c0_g1_i1:224-3001(-)
MAELSEDIKDLNNSVAFNVLDELHRAGSISKAELDLYKSKYGKLHEFVIQTYENEKNFLSRAKQLNQRLMAEKIKLEKTTLESQEDQNSIDQLQSQRIEIDQEYQVAQDREMMLQIQLSELEHEKREKQVQLEEREVERLAEAEPKLQKARDEIEILGKEQEVLRVQKEGYQEKLDEYDQRIKDIELEIENNKNIYKGHELEYNKIKGDPERIRKQAEKFENAVIALQQTQNEKISETEAANELAKKTAAEAAEADDQRSKIQMRLQLMNESSKITDQSCEDVKKRLDRENNTHAELVSKRVSLDQELSELAAQNRAASAEVSNHQKQFERLKRAYKKTLSVKEAVTDSLGPLHSTKEELDKSVKGQEEEIKRQKKLLDDIQAEVDLFIGAYLKQEGLEKDKKEEYDAICQQMEEMQKELKTLKAEEQHWAQHFKTLASHREKLARDASQAHRLCRETADEVAMKELEEEDLKKKHQEISQKQKEFCTMYEVVKNERNKYMTHIQKSSQHLSEMKEKLKILQNEVEILRMESAFKDKQLARTRQEAQRLEVIHDQLQNEKTKITAKGAALNEQVGQYLIEIDKLNSIINSIEKEMVVLRRKYEQAVETRNFTGTQLIDRNDELCILWEKSNIQEKLLKKGEDAMLSRAEELRGLKIDLAEVQRQLRVIRGKIPEVPKFVQEVVSLREQVSSVRRRSEELSRELENPKSSLRKWRKLGGEDLDQETLRVKIQDLEERLNDKKESLLEKELILEEVTALSEKLRSQALDGRQGTMELSQKVNLFQSRIKDVTRKMMATVSELSMHQATAHKLQVERDFSYERAMTARERLQNGQPPTDDADMEFQRILQQEQQRVFDRQAAIQRKQEEEIMNSNFTRTTAEPRVNAYIPEDEHGLPKAYGLNAPFKPSQQGSTMRFIRKPNPKPVEI